MNGKSAIALLIVGMHRSGTSAVAGSMARLGLPLGERLLTAGEDNPKGYFENEAVVRLNDALLDGLGRRWDDPRDLPEGWLQTGIAGEARLAIVDLLEREFSDTPLFALKDPRMCRLLPLWIDALRRANVEPRILLAVRHPFEVCASLESRNGFAPALSEVLWLEHMLAAEHASRSCKRAVITYDELISAPEPALRRAISMLDLGDSITAGQGCAISEFVSAGDRHFAGGAMLSPGTSYDDICRDAFASFTKRPLHAAGFDALKLRLHAQISPALELMDALGAQMVQAKRESEADARISAGLQTQLNAQIAWSDAAVMERESLQAELAEVRSALNAQIAWSDAAVMERESLQAELAEVRSALNAQIAWSDAAVVERETLQVELGEARSALALQAERARSMEVTISRYEATLVGRLQRRWLAWRHRAPEQSRDIAE